MTCVVFQHCVSVGQKVVAGQDLVACEAMKMEVPVASGVSGTVAWLKPMGELVEAGEPVAIIMEEG